MLKVGRYQPQKIQSNHLNSPTVSGCGEMDSERELLKISLGDEFVEGILLAKFAPILVYF